MPNDNILSRLRTHATALNAELLLVEQAIVEIKNLRLIAAAAAKQSHSLEVEPKFGMRESDAEMYAKRYPGLWYPWVDGTTIGPFSGEDDE